MLQTLAGISTAVIAIATVAYVIITILLWRVTKKSADAANRNAKALVNSERAWIMVSPHPGVAVYILHVTTAGEGETTVVEFPLVCKNEGGTPAWITEKFARACIVESTPRTPDQEKASVGDFYDVSLEPLGTGKELAFVADVRCIGRVSGKEFIVLYGFVKYRDVFGLERETRFGYEASAGGKYKRIPADEGLREYNSFS